MRVAAATSVPCFMFLYEVISSHEQEWGYVAEDQQSMWQSLYGCSVPMMMHYNLWGQHVWALQSICHETNNACYCQDNSTTTNSDTRLQLSYIDVQVVHMQQWHTSTHADMPVSKFPSTAWWATSSWLWESCAASRALMSHTAWPFLR